MVEDVMELKEIVRAIRSGRSGQNIEGAKIDNDILFIQNKAYKIQGIQRLRLIEIEIKDKPKNTKKIVTCACGESFEVSKFNPYIKKCPKCRGQRTHSSEGREVKCKICGNSFVISKFNLYLDKDICNSCMKKIRKKNYLTRRKNRLNSK